MPGALQYDVMHMQKLDAYGIWNDSLWVLGIHPWVSFRMNDCYEMELETALLKGRVYGDLYRRFILVYNWQTLNIV